MMPSLSTYFFVYLYIFRDLTWHKFLLVFLFFPTSAVECKPGNMFFFCIYNKTKNVQDSMALHRFNIKYRYNLIPLYKLTSLVNHFSFDYFFIYFLIHFLNRYEFMIHFGFGTYIFLQSRLLPRTFVYMTHTFHHAITANSFEKKN